MLQFVNDNELVALAGPHAACFTDVQNVTIVAFATDGRLIAQKPWPSTSPLFTWNGLTVVNDLEYVYLLDQKMQALQNIAIPHHDNTAVPYLTRDSKGGLNLVLSRDEGAYHLEGPPYSLGERSLERRQRWSLIEDFSEKTVSWDGQTLRVNRGGNQSTLPSASWVMPCKNDCQAYDAGSVATFAENQADRVLLQAKGSRFPITDAAGLFPYYRLLVVDLSSGHEVFKKEFITRTGQRVATISPTGEILATFDGAHTIQLQALAR